MGPLLMLLIGLLLIVAGILAVSGLIISKKPEAKQLIDKIVPFQGIIGVVLLAMGLLFFVLWIGKADRINDVGNKWTLFPFTFYLGTAIAVLLGFLFGMPLIAKWIPGETPAEVKAMEMQKKLAAFNTILGIVGLVFGLLMLYYRFKSVHGVNIVSLLFSM